MSPLMLPFGALKSSPNLEESMPVLFLKDSHDIFVSYNGGESIEFKSNISAIMTNLVSNRFSFLNNYWFFGGYKKIAYSSDLVNWNVVNLPDNQGGATVNGDVHYLPLVDRYMMISSLTYFLSDVGTLDSWTQYVLPGPVQGSTVNYGFISAHQKVFAARTGQNSVIYYTENGTDWNFSDTGILDHVSYAFDYNSNRVFVFGQNISSYAYSSDGISWTQATNFPSQEIYNQKAFASNGSLLVYADRTSGIHRSSDGGNTWVTASRPIFNTNFAISFDTTSNRFVMVTGSQYSGDRLVFYSEDAISWTQSSIPQFAEYAILATRYSFN